MITKEQQTYIDQMYRDRGFSHDFHQVLAAEDFDFLKAYDNLIRAAYVNQRSLDEKTKELLYIVAVTAMKGSVEHIKIHIKLALGAWSHQTGDPGGSGDMHSYCQRTGVHDRLRSLEAGGKPA